MYAEWTWMPIVWGAVTSFVIGMIWYSRAVFGNIWMRLAGVTPDRAEAAKKHMLMSIAGGVITSAVTAGALWSLLMLAPALVLVDALWLAGFAWLGFVVPVLLAPVLWEGKPFALFLLNAAHYLISFLAVAAVLFYLI